MEPAYKRIAALIIKQLKEEITGEEQQELETFARQSPENEALLKSLTDPEKLANMIVWQQQADPEKDHQRLLQRLAQRTRSRRKRSIRQWTAAAAIVIAIAAGTWYLFSSHPNSPPGNALPASPGIAQSFIQLPDSTKIFLDSRPDGNFQAGHTRFTKRGNELTYQHMIEGMPEYHCLYVRPGNTYTLILDDGSHITAGAASVVSFPVSFTNIPRLVKCSGQVYFEVQPKIADTFRIVIAYDALAAHPTPLAEVQVTGTSFDIRAYANEPRLKVALNTGHLRVICKNKPPLELTPGEQAILEGDKSWKTPMDEVTRVAAWRTGDFRFINTDLLTIMRDLERHYGITARFEGAAGEKKITLKGSYSQSLKDVLEMVSNNEISIVSNGNTITLKLPTGGR